MAEKIDVSTVPSQRASMLTAEEINELKRLAAVLRDCGGPDFTETPTEIFKELLLLKAPPERLIRALVMLLPEIKTSGARDTILRTLIGSKHPYDGVPLIKLYESPDVGWVQWVVVYAMSLSRPVGVCEWLVQTIDKPETREHSFVFCEAIVRNCPKDVANEVILGHFSELPGRLATLLGKVGDENTLEFLKSQFGRYEREEIVIQTYVDNLRTWRLLSGCYKTLEESQTPAEQKRMLRESRGDIKSDHKRIGRAIIALEKRLTKIGK